MRARWVPLGCLAAALVAAPGAPARAQTPAYTQHLAAAQKLADDESFAEARAEYEAAYQADPRPDALVGMALCDKALFRYPQAIALLERALADRALGGDGRQRAEAALAEMRPLLGAVQVVLVPPSATLRIDGEDQAPSPERAVQRTIPLGPGSHRLEARLDGYAPAAQTLTLESGETAAVKLRLVTLDAVAAAPAVGAATPRGPYVLGALTVFVPAPPADFSGMGAGVSAGARAGYRFASVAGAEVGFEYAHAGVSGQGKPSFLDSTTSSYPIAYALSSFRFGLHLRLMTTGETVRFVQTFGGGAMIDVVDWSPGPGGPARQDAKGADGFGLSETGFEVDLRHGLIGLTLQQFLGSSGGLGNAKHDAYSAATYGGPQFSLGIGLRGGYRLW